MKLCFSLPKEAGALLDLGENEKIEYCAPFDIDSQSDYCFDGYVVVTGDRIFVIKGNKILSTIALADCSEIKCEGMTDCGILTASLNGEITVLARFSMRHMIRYSYIARGAQLFKQGDFHVLESLEPEQICEKCGHAIPGTNFCPRCQGRRQTFKRMGDLSKPYILRFLFISLTMLITTGLTLYQQSIQAKFIDNVLVPKSGESASLSQIPYYIIILSIVIFSLITVEIVKRILSVLLGAKISMDLRKKLFEKIQTLSLSYQNTRKPGDLMNRVADDTSEVRSFIEGVFSNMFTVLITLIGALVMMFLMDWKLTLISIMLMPLVVIISVIWRKKINRMFHNQRRKSDRINSHLQDVLSGIRIVKCFGREGFEAEGFSKDAASYARTEEKNERFWAYFHPVLGFIAGLGSLLVLYIGGFKMLNGNGFTIGQMAQFVAYSGLIYAPLSWMTNIPRMVMRMTVAISRIDDVFAQKPDILESDKALVREIDGDVEFKNVTFGYKNYEPVLEDINFSVKKGEMIGLVGASGSGKSTMINLIMRLYDCDEGKVLIDGIDIKDYSARSLHNQIGVVLQETFLFADTILNNIRFSKPDATIEEVISAAKTAGAHDFICKFPDGYNTNVGDSGNKLSGGERQRIAIARAVLGQPKLLILDEATSSLDTESEYLIQKGLDRLKAGRTTFAIAHRLSTLKGADRLFVIDGHKIAEMGSHDELMKTSTIYKGLVDAQIEMHSVKGDGPPPPSPH